MKKMLLTLAGAWAALLGASLAGETVEIRSLEPGAAPPAAVIEDISWLAGHWRGEGLGGQSEEIMAPPVGGQIMGMFRQTKADGSLMFYEFYQFAEENGSLIMRIKHFNPDFTGWEEKDISVEFPLVAVEENAVYFDGLTFARHGDVLRAAVMVDGQGVANFVYKRVATP